MSKTMGRPQRPHIENAKEWPQGDGIMAGSREVIKSTERGHESVQADIASGAELLTSRERSLHRDNIDLKRQLDVERNRVAVLMANGGKASIDGGIMTAKERNDEFERRILAMVHMTPEGRLNEAESLIKDVQTATGQKAKWLADIDATTTKRNAAGIITPRSHWVK